MDQGTLVNEAIESGERLIKALIADQFEVLVAFWAKPTEDEKWFLYLASPFVDEKGPREGYGHVFSIMKQLEGLWLEPFEIKVLGVNDSLTQAVLTRIKPKIPGSEFTVRNPQRYRGPTTLGKFTLGGFEIDGAYVYPAPEAIAST